MGSRVAGVISFTAYTAFNQEGYMPSRDRTPTDLKFGKRPVDEYFPNYAPYLDTEVWCSQGTSNETPVNKPVYDLDGGHEMAPQYAAAALAKLVRWAKVNPQGSLTMLDGAEAREETVRTSRLGIALAASACATNPAFFEAIYALVGTRHTDVQVTGRTAKQNAVKALLASVLISHGMNVLESLDLADLQLESIIDTFVIAERAA